MFLEPRFDAYDAMLRRSELADLQVGDLLEEMQGDATLLVRGGKTDGEGRGEIVYLARDTVALVHKWLARSGICDGKLFRSVDKGGTLGERLDPSQVPRIYKAMACRAGLPEAMVEGPVRTQRTGRRCAGHDRCGYRAAGDPPGGALEDHRDGEPLRRATAREAERCRATRAATEARLTATTDWYDRAEALECVCGCVATTRERQQAGGQTPAQGAIPK